MKKLLLVMLLVLVFSTTSYGTTSQDMSAYVRQDVFDAKMEALFERLHGEIAEIKGEINELKSEIRGVDRRIDDLRQDIYL